MYVDVLQQAPDQAPRPRILRRPLWYTTVLFLLAACNGAPQAAVPGAAIPAAPVAMAETQAPNATATQSPTATPAVTATATHLPATSTSAATTAPSPTVPVTATPIEVRPSPTLPALSQEERSRLFDTVWQTVADTYLYSDFNGVDWQRIREQYRQSALDATDAEQFYAALRHMVALLDDRHSRYLSPQEAFQEQARTSGTDVRVDIGIVLSGDRIKTIYENSPAEEASLRRRDRILAVDGQPFAGNSAALRGDAGTTVTLEVQMPGDEPRTVVVERRPVVQKMRPEAYRLPGTNTGYLLIQSFWADDMGEQVEGVLTELLHAGPLDGLIIDLRGNGGGWRPVLQELLSLFMAGKAGEFYRQDESQPLEIMPNALQTRLASTPIVVLVDRGTQSYAEVFSAALQAAGRAEVVGSRTAGNTETIFAHDFDDGSRLWLAGQGFRLPSGDNLEGRGVIPDVEIDVDWMNFSEADDPAIKKALELLRSAGG